MGEFACNFKTCFLGKVNLSNLSWIKKCLFLRNMEPVTRVKIETRVKIDPWSAQIFWYILLVVMVLFQWCLILQNMTFEDMAGIPFGHCQVFTLILLHFLLLWLNGRGTLTRVPVPVIFHLYARSLFHS